jgi:hypothetical protein
MGNPAPSFGNTLNPPVIGVSRIDLSPAHDPDSARLVSAGEICVWKSSQNPCAGNVTFRDARFGNPPSSAFVIQDADGLST